MKTRHQRRARLRALTLALLLSVSAASHGQTEVVAKVGTEPITMEALEAEVAVELETLALQRQQILEAGLERLIESRLLEAEAASRGVSVEELVAAEVIVDPPTDDELEAFYRARASSFPAGTEKETALEQIRGFLVDQRTTQATAELLSRLQARHPVDWSLPPYRFEVDSDGFPARGPATAPVTIVEFSDFECPYCRKLAPTMDRVVEHFGDRVRLVYRHLPLEGIHANARRAAEASLCADEQGEFWAMHDALFAATGLGGDTIDRLAEGLGIDVDEFRSCLDEGRMSEAVRADIQAAFDLGFSGTPVLFINGRQLTGAQSFETLIDIIDEELAAASDPS